MMRRLLVLIVALVLTACGQQGLEPGAGTFVGPAPSAAETLALPSRPDSIKFVALGDMGRGNPPQYEVSAQMQAFREVFPYDFVIMLGDNVYDGGTPEDYRNKFELPYKPLLEDEVEFYAVIGNHDAANQPMYEPFHMGGERYYTFKADASLLARLTDTDVQFFMIDTERLDRTQVAWLEREMGNSEARWKIPVFHRPVYTSGRYAKPARIFRAALEPVFLRHDVRFAMSGHEHFYERTHPQRGGITYFISGGGGSLRQGDIGLSTLAASGFDADYHFMLFEITRDEVFYQAISRTGHSIDVGSIKRE